MTPTPDQLTSWKEIAEHLGVNIRTAQRWEQEKGLPIKRFSGERGRVLAVPEELDRWKASTLERQSWWSDLHFLRIYAMASSAVVVAGLGVALGIYLHSARLGPPARLQVEGKEVIASDITGKELWRYGMSRSPIADYVRKQSWFGHLASPSNTDTLFASRSDAIDSGQLLCLSERGKLRWAFHPGKPVADKNLQYPAVYFVNSFRVLPASGGSQARVVVSSNHAWSYPDQVAVLDASGKLLGEYWHPGHLTALETGSLAPGGPTRIILGGVDNGRHRATLVFLDPNNVHGALAEDDPNYTLGGFGPGTETAVVWFERSCLNEISEEFNYATYVNLLPQGLQVVVHEEPHSAYIVYLLDSNLNVVYTEVSTEFRTLHRELEHQGRLKHTFNEDEVKKLSKIHVLRRS